MPMTPALYVQIGEALFDKWWVYEMRALLDIRKEQAEQIAYHAARGMDYPVPEGLEGVLRDALDAKIKQLAEALVALEGS